jgi:exodeoxyribonuclease V alpha subunit
LFRPLDIEMARFLANCSPGCPTTLLWAAALLGRVESLGHACLDLVELARDPGVVLAWAPDRVLSLQSALSDLPRSAEAAHRLWTNEQKVLSVVGQDETKGTPLGGAQGDIGKLPQTPLVLSGHRLYWRRYWVMERRITQQVLQRAQPWSSAQDAESQRLAHLWLDRLFAATKPAATGEPDHQRLACERALQAGLTLVTGGPGTGKTYTAARLLVALQAVHAGPNPLRIALAAPTGKAAARLRGALEQGLQSLRNDPEMAALMERSGPPVAASTLHALLGVLPGTRRFLHHAGHPLPVDVVLVDEASMVHLEMFDALLQALPRSARLILLGDGEQLASVEAGSVVGDLGAAQPETALARQSVQLTQTLRFAGAVAELATAVNAGDVTQVKRLLEEPPDSSVRAVRGLAAHDGSGKVAAPIDLARLALVGGASKADRSAMESQVCNHAHWLQALQQRPRQREAFEGWALGLIKGFDAFRVLCAVREGPRGVAGVNQAIEREAVSRSWLHVRGTWYEGRPIMVTRNDPGLGLFNGDTGLVLRAPGLPQEGGGLLHAWFATGQGLRSVAVSRLPDVDTAFAMTVHKSQGSEFDHVLMVLPDEDLPVLTRELLYTGITRARRQLTLAYANETVLARCVEKRTRRMSGLIF